MSVYAYINRYKNAKRIGLLCNANVYFNQECLKGPTRITPCYAKIKVPRPY